MARSARGPRPQRVRYCVGSPRCAKPAASPCLPDRLRHASSDAACATAPRRRDHAEAQKDPVQRRIPPSLRGPLPAPIRTCPGWSIACLPISFRILSAPGVSVPSTQTGGSLISGSTETSAPSPALMIIAETEADSLGFVALLAGLKLLHKYTQERATVKWRSIETIAIRSILFSARSVQA
jgi:hypothetical protein